MNSKQHKDFTWFDWKDAGVVWPVSWATRLVWCSVTKHYTRKVIYIQIIHHILTLDENIMYIIYNVSWYMCTNLHKNHLYMTQWSELIRSFSAQLSNSNTTWCVTVWSLLWRSTNPSSCYLILNCHRCFGVSFFFSGTGHFHWHHT